jgi:heterotetrameric sarcosine oxidase gamma subunit
MLERHSALAAHPKMMNATAQKSLVNEPPLLELSERNGLVVLQVSAFTSTTLYVQTLLAKVLDLPVPEANRFSGSANKSFRCVSSGVWLLIGLPDELPSVEWIRSQLTSNGTVADLSHARCCLNLSGETASRTLAKFCGLDLFQPKFPTGSATNTRFGHIGMHLARTDDIPTYELLVFRGYSEFVFEALCYGAAEFGYIVRK